MASKSGAIRHSTSEKGSAAKGTSPALPDKSIPPLPAGGPKRVIPRAQDESDVPPSRRRSDAPMYRRSRRRSVSARGVRDFYQTAATRVGESTVAASAQKRFARDKVGNAFHAVLSAMRVLGTAFAPEDGVSALAASTAAAATPRKGGMLSGDELKWSRANARLRQAARMGAADLGSNPSGFPPRRIRQSDVGTGPRPPPLRAARSEATPAVSTAMLTVAGSGFPKDRTAAAVPPRGLIRASSSREWQDGIDEEQGRSDMPRAGTFRRISVGVDGADSAMTAITGAAGAADVLAAARAAQERIRAEAAEGLVGARPSPTAMHVTSIGKAAAATTLSAQVASGDRRRGGGRLQVMGFNKSADPTLVRNTPRGAGGAFRESAAVPMSESESSHNLGSALDIDGAGRISQLSQPDIHGVSPRGKADAAVAAAVAELDLEDSGAISAGGEWSVRGETPTGSMLNQQHPLTSGGDVTHVNSKMPVITTSRLQTEASIAVGQASPKVHKGGWLTPSRGSKASGSPVEANHTRGWFASSGRSKDGHASQVMVTSLEAAGDKTQSAMQGGPSSSSPRGRRTSRLASVGQAINSAGRAFLNGSDDDGGLHTEAEPITHEQEHTRANSVVIDSEGAAGRVGDRAGSPDHGPGHELRDAAEANSREGPLRSAMRSPRRDDARGMDNNAAASVRFDGVVASVPDAALCEAYHHREKSGWWADGEDDGEVDWGVLFCPCCPSFWGLAAQTRAQTHRAEADAARREAAAQRASVRTGGKSSATVVPFSEP